VSTPTQRSRRVIREKVSAYRRRLREQGLRPVQVWVPDVRSAAFKAEARRQARAVARSRGEVADQQFIDALSELSFE
jgi:hypothetical protein